MAAPTMKDAVRAYWDAVGSKGAQPKLPTGDFDAFVELLHLTSSSKDAFRLVDLPSDPYPGLVVGDSREPWALAWAAHVAELEAFAHPAEPEMLFFADSLPDPKGHHRVYSHVDGIRGMIEFADLPEALSWMAIRVLRARGKAPQSDLDAATDRYATVLEDLHEESTTSGFFVFETLLDAPFGEAWDAYSRGEWPVVEAPPIKFRLRRQGGWQRALSLYLVQRFLEKRIVDFPKSVKTSELGAAHRALLSHLTDFEESMRTGIVPTPIEKAAKSADSAIAERAKTWIERHDGWRTRMQHDERPDDHDDADDDDLSDSTPPPPKTKARGAAKGKKAPTPAAEPAAPESPEPAVDTPFMARLRALLRPALDALVDEELVEVVAEKKPAVLAEMLAAAADARSPQHLLKQLAGALVHSDHVDEVFGSDEELQDFLRARLGGA